MGVLKIDYYDSKGRLLAIVSYVTGSGHQHSMAIEKKYDAAGRLQSELGFSCNGTFDCKLNAVKNPDGTLYSAECSCSSCSMTVTVYNSTTPNKSATRFDVQSIAETSQLETFKKADKVMITDLRYTDTEKALIEVYTYKNSAGLSSTFMTIHPSVEIRTTDNIVLKVAKTYIVDCTGSCDCKERFLPATNGIECTCSPCSMKVTEVPATP